MCGNYLTVWQPGVVEMSGRLLCFPWQLNVGISAAGWAGLGPAGREEGRGGGGYPAGVWLRSNPGDYYCWDTHIHTHMQTHQRWYLLLASVLTTVPPSPLPRSEVITRSLILRGELSHRSGRRINGLSSLCEQCCKA